MFFKDKIPNHIPNQAGLFSFEITNSKPNLAFNSAVMTIES